MWDRRRSHPAAGPGVTPGRGPLELHAREFPICDPYPNGAKREARLLVRHILISEVLLDEFGRPFEGLSEGQVVALAESCNLDKAKRHSKRSSQ